MALIEAQDAAGFEAYLRATQNTICGRHPICVLLHALACGAAAAGGGGSGEGSSEAASRFRVAFTHYAQSSRAASEADSSVSYAAAVVALL
jgi:predicted class III extradiol MEMO1 family dioxygenase